MLKKIIKKNERLKLKKTYNTTPSIYIFMLRIYLIKKKNQISHINGELLKLFIFHINNPSSFIFLVVLRLLLV